MPTWQGLARDISETHEQANLQALNIQTHIWKTNSPTVRPTTATPPRRKQSCQR